jgi:hypothetical protein
MHYVETKYGFEYGAAKVTRCTSPSSCSQVLAIESAVLNIGTAASDCGSARDSWIDANWNDTVMWINCAIAQLESARAKIQSHVANAEAHVRDRSEIGLATNRGA